MWFGVWELLASRRAFIFTYILTFVSITVPIRNFDEFNCFVKWIQSATNQKQHIANDDQYHAKMITIKPVKWFEYFFFLFPLHSTREITIRLNEMEHWCRHQKIPKNKILLNIKHMNNNIVEQSCMRRNGHNNRNASKRENGNEQKDEAKAQACTCYSQIVVCQVDWIWICCCWCYCHWY